MFNTTARRYREDKYTYALDAAKKQMPQGPAKKLKIMNERIPV